jgi:XTP/dITP diphosphohydrolase
MLFFGFNKLVIASGNPGKLAEFDALLAPLGIQVISQTALGITDPKETGIAFVENALIKARNAAKLSGFAALADDSGLCVDVLDGAPGLISAHYAGEHGNAAANIAKLLSEMRGAHNRSAKFISVLVLVRHALDPLPLIAQGEWRGEILSAPRGTNGFGYDSIFYDVSLGKSAAELDSKVKNVCSHRAKALFALSQQLL